MPEHQEIVDAFTDTPQTAAMTPKPEDEDEGTDDTPTDDLGVQGGE